jgi:hypothetical protein
MENLKYLAAVIILAAGMVLFNNELYGQGCHGGGGMRQQHQNVSNPKSHEMNIHGRHGGMVKQAGKYNIEMVFEPANTQNPLVFYLTTRNGKSINTQEIAGSAEIIYSDKSIESIMLEAFGENGLAGTIQNRNSPFICLLTMQINKKNITVRFNHPEDFGQFHN